MRYFDQSGSQLKEISSQLDTVTSNQAGRPYSPASLEDIAAAEERAPQIGSFEGISPRTSIYRGFSGGIFALAKCEPSFKVHRKLQFNSYENMLGLLSIYLAVTFMESEGHRNNQDSSLYRPLVKFKYKFPPWLLGLAISIFFSTTLQGDPSAGITIRRLAMAQPSGPGSIIILSNYGDYVGIKGLLERRKAHVHNVNSRGLTPLHCALWGGHMDAIKVLLAAGADPLFEDDEGLPAISWAVKWLYGHHARSKICERLGDMLPWSKFFDEYGFSYLHRIAIGHLPVDIEEALPAHRLQMNLKDEIGRTPLHYAALRGNATAIKALLEGGADVDAKSCKGDTPLVWACFSHSLESVQLLLCFGASVKNVSSREVYSPLHAITFSGTFNEDSRAILELLLDHGADINAQNNPRRTSPINLAATKSNIEALESLIQAGADVDIADFAGDVALTDAIVFLQTESLELLLRYKADHLHINRDGLTILHKLAMHGNAEVADVLSRAELKGLDPEARDREGRTPSQVLKERIGIPEGLSEAFNRHIAEIRKHNMETALFVEENEEPDFFDAAEVFATEATV
ncbi:MAG: hypothetical protein Q9227_000505 [Pyrenula ochraceoflavens]